MSGFSTKKRLVNETEGIREVEKEETEDLEERKETAGEEVVGPAVINDAVEETNKRTRWERRTGVQPEEQSSFQASLRVRP